MKYDLETVLGPAIDWCLERGDPRAAVLRAIATGERTHVVAEWLLRCAHDKVRADRAAAKSGAHRTNGWHLYGYGTSLAARMYPAYRANQIMQETALEAEERYGIYMPNRSELDRILADANTPISFEIHGALEVLDVDAILGGSP